jgi:hypothetical protein
MNVFLYDNLVKTSGITADPSNAQFPVSNLKDDRRTKVVRAESASMEIIFDFGMIREVDSFAVVESGISAFGFTSLTFELNINNEWVTPIYSGPVPLDLQFGFGYLLLDNVVNARYARIVINNSAGFCELSKVFIGKKASIGELCFEYPLTFTQKNNASIQKNRFGQRFVDEVNGQKELSGSFSTLTKEEMDSLFSVLDYVSNTIPLWLIFPEGNITLDNDRINGYYYLTGEPNLTFDRGNYWSAGLSLEEGT